MCRSSSGLAKAVSDEELQIRPFQDADGPRVRALFIEVNRLLSVICATLLKPISNARWWKRLIGSRPTMPRMAAGFGWRCCAAAWLAPSAWSVHRLMLWNCVACMSIPPRAESA
jgi:hypothetical protein